MKQTNRKAVLKMQAKTRQQWCVWCRFRCCPSSTALNAYCDFIYNCLLEPRTDFIPKIPKTNLKTFGGRSFGYIAPTVWNSLPADLRASPSLPTVKVNLKTYLFRQAFWLICTCQPLPVSYSCVCVCVCVCARQLGAGVGTGRDGIKGR